MKVLKDNYVGHVKAVKVKEKKATKPYPRKLVCSECLSELEYEKSDLHMGFLGCIHLRCPCCGYENMIEDNEDTITLTKDNVEFPTHFYHFSKKSGAVDCCNNERVKEYIQDGINYFRKNKDEYFWSCTTGNIYVCINRCEGDENYCITESNDLYDTDIPFESADYKDGAFN